MEVLYLSIDNISIKNITVFNDLEIDFSKGINIIIGQNGTGKTSLLKMIYAACEWSNEKIYQNKSKDIFSYFSHGKKDIESLKNYENKDGNSYYKVKNEENIFYYSLSEDKVIDFNQWENLSIKSVFIPTTEMLSHSRGFLAMNQKYNMPFDATQIDIIVNAELPEIRKVSSLNTKLLDILSNIMDGKVIYENDTFYVVKSNGMKIEFSFEAEGLRKFGLLWKLLRNGLLEKDTILLWDEPEANVNPELMPTLVEIILELQKNGVQVFIATHNYNLAKYFEIKRTDNNIVLYHNLYKTNNGVKSESSEYFGKIKNNPIIEADSRLLDEVIEGNFEE